MAEPAARTDVDDVISELREEKTRSHRRSWRDARRKGIVESFHDVENCEWCALIDQLSAALVSVREERDEARREADDGWVSEFCVLHAALDRLRTERDTYADAARFHTAARERAEDALRQIEVLAFETTDSPSRLLDEAGLIAREALKEAGDAE